MNEHSVTRTTTAILAALAEAGNEQAWHEFDDRYRPMITRFLRRLGLDQSDAADVAQETLAQFVRDYRQGKYDRTRGRLRSWIIGIAKHRLADWRRSNVAREERLRETLVVDLSDVNQLEAIWETEFQQALLCDGLRQLRETTNINAQTIDAFRMYVIEQQPAETVAERLGMKVRAVYVAKHRCLDRMREILTQLRASYELS
jgi:RNA polymerase sigma-70 factor (ECF subfamily)